MTRRFVPIFFGLLLTLNACKKEPVSSDPPVTLPAVADPAKVVVDLSHYWGDDELQLLHDYIDPKGDSVSFTKFMYYISNVVLKKADGSTYTEANSYHLIDHVVASTKSFTLSDVPEGEYTSISFMIGVDSLRNVSGAQTGDLDPAKGMFWTWNSGYIFLKLEGYAPKSPANGGLTYHIGGYMGQFKTQRIVKIEFPATPLKANIAAYAHLKLKTNVSEIFQNPNLIDVATLYYQMGVGEGAKKIADNYADMFAFKSVLNP